MEKHLPMATRKLKARLNIEEQQPWGPPLGKKKKNASSKFLF